MLCASIHVCASLHTCVHVRAHACTSPSIHLGPDSDKGMRGCGVHIQAGHAGFAACCPRAATTASPGLYNLHLRHCAHHTPHHSREGASQAMQGLICARHTVTYLWCTSGQAQDCNSSTARSGSQGGKACMARSGKGSLDDPLTRCMTPSREARPSSSCCVAHLTCPIQSGVHEGRPLALAPLAKLRHSTDVFFTSIPSSGPNQACAKRHLLSDLLC